MTVAWLAHPFAGGVVWPSRCRKPVPLRERLTISAPLREIRRLIPPEEMAAAALCVLDQALSCTEETLVRETARALGITRSGARGNAAVALAIEFLLGRGLALRERDRIARSPRDQNPSAP